MCTIHMRVQCSERFSEVLVDDVEHTELTIESILGTALLELFDAVVVENVIVHPSPEDDDLEVFDTGVIENVVFPPAPEDDDDGEGF